MNHNNFMEKESEDRRPVWSGDEITGRNLETDHDDTILESTMDDSDGDDGSPASPKKPDRKQQQPQQPQQEAMRIERLVCPAVQPPQLPAALPTNGQVYRPTTTTTTTASTLAATTNHTGATPTPTEPTPSVATAADDMVLFRQVVIETLSQREMLRLFPDGTEKADPKLVHHARAAVDGMTKRLWNSMILITKARKAAVGAKTPMKTTTTSSASSTSATRTSSTQRSHHHSHSHQQRSKAATNQLLAAAVAKLSIDQNKSSNSQAVQQNASTATSTH